MISTSHTKEGIYGLYFYLTRARQWCINYNWNLSGFGTFKVWTFKHIFSLNTFYTSTKIQSMEYLVSLTLAKHVSHSFPCPFRPAEWPAARKADPYAHNPETQSRVYLKSLSVCPNALLLLLRLPLCTSSDWKVYRLIHHQSWHCVKWASVQSKSKLLLCFLPCVASVRWMILDPYCSHLASFACKSRVHQKLVLTAEARQAVKQSTDQFNRASFIKYESI